MISDEERRNIAASLRHEAAKPNVGLAEWWMRLHEIVTGEDDFPDPQETVLALAKLIDEPTCTMEKDEFNVVPYEYWCSNCGKSNAFDPYDYEYCPHCGKKVEKDGA